MKPLSLMNSSTKGAILHQGNFIISIENLSDYSRPVIVKRPSKWMTSMRSPGSLDREYDMSRSLDSIKGVRKVLGKQQIEDQQVLILEYIEGETLQGLIAGNDLDIRSKLEIAIDIARILGEIHQQNIIHLDINSSNILIRKKRREVHLIDLGSASLENLSYISPEQTGRLNRSLDERSDLYSMGVVLYELMTGQLPFDSKDPMEVVHYHIARRPESPTEVTSEIPEILGAIILKLLSKNAEDRYQSAAGIQADLDKCLRNLSPDNTIEGFPLGEVDYSNRLRFTQKLYGRDSELKELESAFESVCRGNSSIVFIAGDPGIGKTAMIEEMKQPVSEKNGYYIQGKFDQLITTPYAGIPDTY
jgi:serine/threonine protein kinase